MFNTDSLKYFCFRCEKLTQYLHINAAVARLRHDDSLYQPLAKVPPLVDMHTITLETDIVTIVRYQFMRP